MNLPLPEGDAVTAAEVRDWLDRFAACVREVDYAAARPFWHPDIVIFGTYQELVQSLSAWTERQWDNVGPRTAEFRFDLRNTMVLASPYRAMAYGVSSPRKCKPVAAFRRGPSDHRDITYCTIECNGSQRLLVVCCLAWVDVSVSKCFEDQPVEYMLNRACGGP